MCMTTLSINPEFRSALTRMKWLFRGLLLLVALGGVFLTPVGQAQEPPRFRFPLVCTINEDCFFANYVDHRSGPGAQDYQCGPITYDGHRGTDIPALNFRLMDRGVYAVAAAEGTVVAVQDGQFDRNKRVGTGGYGNHVILEHAGGIRTIYAHLKKNSIRVRVGDSVQAGEELAEIGSSGSSTDAHLHFEVRDASDRMVDPFQGPCGNPVSWWAEQPPYENAFQVLDYGMTNFEPTLEQLKERPATRTDFRRNDPLFLFWVQVKSVKAGDVARVEFYNPQGRLFRRSEFRHDRYYRYSWWYWFWLREAWVGEPTGRWTVRYYLNNRLYVTMPFFVHPTPPQGPEIWLAETSLDFGSVQVGGTREYRLIVENLGRANLQISLQSNNSVFRVARESVTVRPGGKELIAITFAPAEAESYQGRITLTTNDPDEGTIPVSVRGRGHEGP